MKTTRRALFEMLAVLFLLAVWAYFWPTSPADFNLRQFHIVGDVELTGISGVCVEGDQLTVWVAGRPGNIWICTADEFSWMRAFDVMEHREPEEVSDEDH